ncbi:PTS lactose transporter subunit IIBC [Lactobacillus sp. ESL0731]|uniref:PTS lactose transporter subunit IIBC n=1 Tax=unclassified Lactobacillus TaxID=2620435 RepID=UPI0023F6EBA0|nr:MULTISPECIES: PTS lactose transporter subunit IIBC [unclassified Lactobacillus]WEV51451.1 PTS lactose transporter subunit IIBC [Lactobacillus sp. ESL0700]WEV62580.1 PTS lactose transporter subunit IIBC [Lactobacillus sp. ESL0731]
MNALIKQIEKAQPFFQKVAANKYLRAVRDGFIALMPIIIFSSLFLLVANVPLIWHFAWPVKVSNALNMFYNMSMGVLALMASSSVSKALTDSLNLDLPKTSQIPTIGVQFTAQVSFILVAVDTLTDKLNNIYFAISMIGTKGLICAFLVAFIVPNVYYICFKHHITIKLPDAVPQNISSAFENIIPFAISTGFFWVFSLAFRAVTGTNLATWIIQILSPLFTAADGYFGLAIVYGAMAFFWFIGIQGPSIVEPAVTAIYLSNVELNLAAWKSGNIAGANKILAQGTQYFVATLGGTGATLVITLMFAFWAKSKELKAVGRAASIPVLFGVNEPILFGAPLILNPVFFIPFLLTPIANVWLFKIFVDVFHMPGFIYNLPWTTPGTLGLIMGTGFSIGSIILAILLLIVDTIMYYPFFKAYDIQKCNEEAQNVSNKEQAPTSTKAEVESASDVTETKPSSGGIPLSATKDGKELNVLVLCAGGGTSGILAKALNKLATENSLPLSVAATSFGSHHDLLSGMDIVILAPQMNAMKDELKKECDQNNAKMITTTGKQYINMTQHADKCLDLIIANISN